MNSVLLYASVGGCAFSVLLAVALTPHRRRSVSGNRLAVIVLLISLDELLYSVQQWPQFPFPAITHLTSYAGLLFAPLWFAVISARATETSHRTGQWWQYCFFPVFQITGVVEIMIPSQLPWLTIHHALNQFSFFIMAAYLMASMHAMLKAAREKPPVSGQTTAHRGIRDSRVMITSLFVVCGAYLSIAIANLMVDDAMLRTVMASAYGAITFALFMLAYSFVRQLFSRNTNNDEVKSGTVINLDREKYGNNRLPDFVRKSIINRLTEYMNSEQPWRKIDLTLGELAAAIDLNPHHLSQIINSEFGKSFACFINEYRVNAACHSLTVSDNKTIIEIALESGFASKSSFNALFKKHTGATPSEYRRMSRDGITVGQLQQVS